MGRFNKSQAASEATGAPNTPRTLLDESVPGSGVPEGNAFEVEAHFSLFGDPGITGTPTLKLNGVEVYDHAMGGHGSRAVLRASIWRTGNTTGVATGTISIPGVGVLELEEKSLTGLSWSGGQDVTIEGISNQQGGLICQRAGVDWS